MRHFWHLLFGAILLVSAGCHNLRTDFYPLGIYSVPSTNDLSDVKAAGFNMVAGPPTKSYLDAAEVRGLRVLAYPGTSAGPAFRAMAARQTVRTLDRHPALWAWYLVDEPDLNLISPDQVRAAHRFIKSIGAKRPTALVIYQGPQALHYANITDILMIDRYPIPWLPLANFSQHVRMTRLALGKKKPLIAVIQAFDWSYYPKLLPGEKNLRPPTYEELRCMTYCALAQRANGIFYYAFDDGRWKIRERPETWSALQRVVTEVNERLPLFQAGHLWWIPNHDFEDREHRFNEALESSISSTWLRVNRGNQLVPAGDYILAVNNTDRTHRYSFELPKPNAGSISVFDENRALPVNNNRVEDEFPAYGVHVYGPLGSARGPRAAVGGPPTGSSSQEVTR
jgi:hypothetical protein